MTTVRTIAGHRVSVSEPDQGTVFIGATSMRRYSGFLSPSAIVDITRKLGVPDHIHENAQGSVYTLEYLIEDMPKKRKAA